MRDARVEDQNQEIMTNMIRRSIRRVHDDRASDKIVVARALQDSGGRDDDTDKE